MEEKIRAIFDKIQNISIKYGCYEGLSADLGCIKTLLEDYFNEIQIYTNKELVFEENSNQRMLSDDEEKAIRWLKDITDNSVINCYYAEKYANIILNDFKELQLYRKQKNIDYSNNK